MFKVVWAGSNPYVGPNVILTNSGSIPVASIFNVSIQQTSVPAIWKKANVIPIQKTKVLIDINTDLRQISLTPTLAKICKRFVSDHNKPLLDRS